MPKFWLRFVVAGVILGVGLLACRSGFDPAAREFLFTAGDPQPFGGAGVESVALDPDGARLETLPGFAAMRSTLPAPVAAAAASAEGGQILVGGGSAIYPGISNCSEHLLRYDPVQDSLEVAARLTAPMRGLSLLTTSAGDLYSLMGYCTSSDEEYKVYRYQRGSQALAYVGSFVEENYFFAAGVLADGTGRQQLVVAGGFGSGPLHKSIQVMDPETGQASVLTQALASERCLMAGAAAGDRLYVFGGSTDVNCELPAHWNLNPLVADIVAVGLAPPRADLVGSLPEPRAGGCAVARQDGTIVIFGGVAYRPGLTGFDPVVQPGVLLFDPADNSVAPYPVDLLAPRAGQACARTADDRVLLFGGADENLRPTGEILVFEPFAASGTLSGPPVGSQVPGARWTTLELVADLPAGTAVQVEVRIADDPASWTGSEAGYQAVLPGVLSADLPRGRYLQWRATLTTTNPTVTPTLRSVRLGFAVQ